ncbi:MAG TPA: fatty acid desaturase [Pseudomonas sp.]|uniref:fatty acid desaturase n=1 Tax=Pseudomonas sp. TaxID=306 RepID=UPI002B46A3EC|nr:fatty acid desaturase [Pseudomonas sp.]HKS13849.1 fatty acid desaturase [Pseudomonas sp.]
MKPLLLDKPTLRPDRRLLAPSALETALVTGYALLLFGAPLALFVAVAGQAPAAGWLALPLLLPAGYGLFLQGILGHEGFHFNLSGNRLLSCLLAVLLSSMLCGFCVTGYFVDHWQHHRYNGGPQDPDWRLLRRYRLAVTRLLVSRLHATGSYLVQTVRLALPGAHVAGALPLPDGQIRLLARVNLACQLLWPALWLLLASQWPMVLPAVAGCLLLALLISALNAYQEHAFDTSVEHPVARSRTACLSTLLHLGSNYHLEHHLYPRVPCWRLPRLHRQLLASGWYQDRHALLEPRFFGALRYCTARFPYAGALQATPTHTPSGQ